MYPVMVCIVVNAIHAQNWLRSSLYIVTLTGLNQIPNLKVISLEL